MNGPLSFEELRELVGARTAPVDVACPLCGPRARAPRNKVRKVLRIWPVESGFASYCCMRCPARGWASDRSGADPDPALQAMIQRARIAADRHTREHRAKQRDKAQWLWRVSQPAEGSIPRCYLHKVRHLNGPIPETLRFLPAREQYPPAIVAGFGLPDEIEPGCIVLPIAKCMAVQLIRLRPDGAGKADEADEPAKITVGSPGGTPIVLAPMNDLLGLAIAEGVEDALSIHLATGLGAWAAAGWAQLPALADTVPDYTECVTVFSDADPDGRKGAAELVRRLCERGICAEQVLLDDA